MHIYWSDGGLKGDVVLGAPSRALLRTVSEEGKEASRSVLRIVCLGLENKSFFSRYKPSPKYCLLDMAARGGQHMV